jgi:hypothetical protein
MVVRRRVLIRSITKLLPAEERVLNAAPIWTFHPYAPLIALAAAGAPVAVLSSFTDATWSQRLLWAGLIAVVATSVSTRFRILATTTGGVLLLRSSSIRQVAVEVLERWTDAPPMDKLGGNLATSEWRIDGTTYTVSKRAEKELQHMTAGHRRDRR